MVDATNPTRQEFERIMNTLKAECFTPAEYGLAEYLLRVLLCPDVQCLCVVENHPQHHPSLPTVEFKVRFTLRTSSLSSEHREHKSFRHSP